MENVRNRQQREQGESWPTLPFEAWLDTRETLHLWTQIVGKVRMELSPPMNHWWQSASITYNASSLVPMICGLPKGTQMLAAWMYMLAPRLA